jgi:calpain-15
MFIDRKFGPNAKSLGAVEGDSANAESGKAESDVEWIRCSRIATSSSSSNSDRKPRVRLFEGEIDPNDIGQGGLGDCWLMAAMACLASVPGAIQKLFVTPEIDPRGKYCVRLFDGQLGPKDSNGHPEGKWVYVYIDDHVPCSKEAWKDGEGSVRSLYAQPKGGEIWVLLLEKAFAKLCGSYAALEGGDTAWALRAMTGEKAFAFSKAEGGESWQRQDLVSEVDAKDKRASCYFKSNEPVQTKEAMFKVCSSAVGV